VKYSDTSTRTPASSQSRNSDTHNDVNSMSNTRSKKPKYSQTNLSSHQLATDVPSSYRSSDDRFSSSRSTHQHISSAGSQSDTTSTGITLTCYNPHAVENTPPPTPTTQSSNQSRGVTRNREDSPPSRNQLPRSCSSMSSITHITRPRSNSPSREVTFETPEYVLQLAETLLHPSYSYLPHTELPVDDPDAPTITNLANMIHSTLATTMGSTIPLSLIRDIVNQLHNFLIASGIMFPRFLRAHQCSLDHYLWSDHIPQIYNQLLRYSFTRQHLHHLRQLSFDQTDRTNDLEIEQLAALTELIILLENQPVALPSSVAPTDPSPAVNDDNNDDLDGQDNNDEDDYEYDVVDEILRTSSDAEEGADTLDNLGDDVASRHQSLGEPPLPSNVPLFSVNFAGSPEESVDVNSSVSSTMNAQDAAHSTANLSCAVADAHPFLTRCDPLLALAMLATGQILKPRRPKMDRRTLRKAKGIALKREQKQLALSIKQSKAAATSGYAPPRKITLPSQSTPEDSFVSYEAAVKLLLLQFDMGLTLEDINTRLLQTRSKSLVTSNKSKLSDTERRRIHRAEKKLHPTFTSLDPTALPFEPTDPFASSESFAFHTASPSGEQLPPSSSRPPAEPPPSSSPDPISSVSGNVASGLTPCFATLDNFLSTPFDSKLQSKCCEEKLSDLLDDFCIDTLFQPPPPTFYLQDSIAIPCCFQTPKDCHSLLIDAALVAHIKLPSGSKGKQLRNVYPRSRLQALRSFIQGSYNIKKLSKSDRGISKTLKNIDESLVKQRVPLHYDPNVLTNLPVDSFSMPGCSRDGYSSKLSPTAAYTSSLNSVYLGSHYAILDTGAAHHFLSPDVNVTRKHTAHRQMLNANGKVTNLTEAGDLVIQLQDVDGSDINPLIIQDCSICPDSPISLLSVSRLIQQNAQFRFNGVDDSFMRYHGYYFKLLLLNNLWVLDLTRKHRAVSIPHDHFCTMKTETSPHTLVRDALSPAYAVTADLWHKRCGHVNIKRLRQHHNNHRALGLHFPETKPHNSACICETCLLANNVTRSVKPQRTHHSDISRKGQLLTADIVGPFPITPEGHRYAISFTDEYTRFSTVYFLSKKSDAPDALSSLIKYYKFMNITITEIRTDQGGEFGGHHERTSLSRDPQPHSFSENIPQVFGQKFKDVCAAHDIKHTLMPAHTPQLHGIAERWNRTVITMANAMLLEAAISPVLWSSAVAHANLIRNMLPTKVLGDYSPYELFTGRLPRFDNLRVWGSYCYRNIPNKRKIPGLPMRERLIYVGETPDRVGFRCFDPVKYKFTTEYDLLFDETSHVRRKQLLDYFDGRRKLAEKEDYSGIPLVMSEDSTDPVHTDPAIRKVYLPSSQGDLMDDQSPSNDIVSTSPPLTEVVNHTSEGVQPSPCGKSVRFEGVHHLAPVAQKKLRSGSPRRKLHHEHSLESESLVSHNIDDHIVKDSVSMNKPNDTTTPPNNLLHHPNDHCNKRKKGPVVGRNNGALPTSSSSPKSDITQLSVSASPLRSILKHPPNLSSPITNLTDRYATSPVASSKQDGNGSTLSSKPSITQTESSEFGLQVTQSDCAGPLSSGETDRTQVDTFSEEPLLCPIRRFPVGKLQKIAPGSSRWLKLARQADIPIRVQQANPKHVNSQSYHRYQLVRQAITVAQYYDILQSSGVSIGKITQDIQNDFQLGYVTFPNNTHTTSLTASAFAFTALLMAHNPSSDLVDATSVTLAGQQHDTSSLYNHQPSFQNVIEHLWNDDPAINFTDAEYNSLSNSAMSSLNSLLMPGLPEPTGYKDAVREDHPEREHWIAAIEREINTLESRGTWTRISKDVLYERNKGKSKEDRKRPVRCKFVFKKKFNKDGTVQYKARLVACGYTQVAGQDFSSDELYASVCSYSSMRFLMSLATQKNYLLFQTDIQGAYLEPDLKDEIYMEPPLSMCPDGPKKSDILLKINKGLYGLKQSGWAWAQCFKDFLTRDPDYHMGFTPMTGEPNLYRKSFKLNGIDSEIFIGQYVDDCFIAASSQAALDWFIEKMSKRYPVNPNSSGVVSMSSPGRLLSMHVYYDQPAGILYFNQEQAISKLADKLGLAPKEPIDSPLKDPIRSLPFSPQVELPKYDSPQDGISTTDYLSVIGSCLHIAQVSRPDCAYAVGALSRHSHAPGKIHMKAARDLVSYMYKTRHWSIQYQRSFSPAANVPIVYEKDCYQSRTIEDRLKASVPDSTPNTPDVYCDADFAGCKVTRRSTSGMVIMMNGGPISWQSRLQKLCAQSSAESEIYAVTDSVKEALHIRLLCEESGLRPQNVPLTIWEDNNACIQLGHNLKGSNAAKHFELRLRLLNEHINSRNIEFSRINTDDQMADPFTKPLARPAFEKFRSLMMVNRPPV